MLSTDLVLSLIGGVNKMHQLSEIINDDKNLDKKIAEIGTYLILNKTLPKVLESPYLKEFTDDCRSILSNLEKSGEEEQKHEVGVPKASIRRGIICKLCKSATSIFK